MLNKKYPGPKMYDYNPYVCNSIGPGARMLNMERSMVLLNKSSDNSSQQSIEMICSFSTIDGEFIKMKQNFTNMTYEYLGFYDKIFRLYPGRDMCFNYDPTIRPWYVAAAAGSKNVFLVLNNGDKIDVLDKLINLKLRL